MALQRDKIVANAEKLVGKGKVEPAIREYERLLDENPNDVNTLNRIGDLWVRLERNDEAVKVFRRIADHYAKDGFFLKAIAIYKKINKLDPSKLDIYAKLAELYAKQGLAMEAKSQYMVLADYYIKHGDSESALNIYKKIAELDPNSVNVHIKLADLHSQTHNTTEALQEYDRVGRMLLKRGMSVEAVQVFRKALKIDAGNVDLAESLVTALLEEKNYDNAIQILQTALESNRENPRLIVLMARTHLAKGDLKAGRSALEQGLSSNPSDVGIREALADLYLHQDDADRALELIGPLVTLALNKSDGPTAVGLLNHVLKSDPDHVGSLERLISAYTQLKEASNVTDAMNRLAEAHLAQANHEQAETVLRELLRRDPENLQNREKLAFVQQHTGSEPYVEAKSPEAPAPLNQDRKSSHVVPEEPSGEQTQPHRPPVEFIQAPDVKEKPDGDEKLFTLADEIADEIDEEIDEEIEIEIEEETEEEIDDQVVEDIEEHIEPISTHASQSSASQTPGIRPRSSEDHEFITEHVTEAEVFVKYGLTEKAVEHLASVISRVPDYLPAYEKLLSVYMTEGEADRVSETAGKYISILRSNGELEKADAVEHDVWNHGFSLPEKAEAPTSTPAPADVPQEPEIETAAVEESLRFESTPEREMNLDDIPDLLPDELAPETSPELENIISTSGSDLDFDFGDLPLDDLKIVEATAEPLPEETMIDLSGDDTDAIAGVDSASEVLLAEAPDSPESEPVAAVDDASATVDDVKQETEQPDSLPLAAAETWDEENLVAEELTTEELVEEEAREEESTEPVAENLIEDELVAEELITKEPVVEEPVTEELLTDDLADDLFVDRQPSWASAEPQETEQIEQKFSQGSEADEAAVEALSTDDLSEELAALDDIDDLDEESFEEIGIGSQSSAFFGVESERTFSDFDPDHDGLPAEGPAIEDLGELDFYIDQELLEEARGKFDSLSAQYPHHPEIVRRAERLHVQEPDLALQSSGNTSSAREEESPLSDREVISDLLSSADLERDLVFTLPEDPEQEENEEDQLKMAVESSRVSMKVGDVPPGRDEDDLFAAEDEFFDLAAELEEELEDDLDQMPSASEEEQSLEQIFREFKKGVEQQLDSEDYDTHYNLGIAYKEMGLIDEAIGEFQLASKDPQRAIDGCSMLGLCFLEKGMPQLAIKWYTKGLEVPSISEEEHLGLMYDLGTAYLEVGDTEQAHKTFLDVFGINSKYRDIAGRIKQLDDARRIH